MRHVVRTSLTLLVGDGDDKSRDAAPQVGGVNFTDEPVVEVNPPMILSPRFESDGLPGEGFDDEAAASLPLDLTVGSQGNLGVLSTVQY